MEYNIHPIFVHFPIAFLFLYSFLVLIPVEKLFPKISWKQFRIVLGIVGLLGALISSGTGEIAEELTNPNHDISEMHKWFAGAATFVYGLLLLTDLWHWLEIVITKLHISVFSKIITYLRPILTSKFFVFLIAITGLLFMSITGMLGGIMVYGTSADPLAPFLLKLLGI